MKRVKIVIKHIENNYWNEDHSDNCKICNSQVNGTFLDGLRWALVLLKNK